MTSRPLPPFFNALAACATCLPTKAMTLTNCDARCATQALFRSSGRRNRKHTIRYDKLATNFLSGAALATAVAFRL